MSKRYNNGSHYENHPQAAELHNFAAHAHSVGEQSGKQEHLSGHEHSRQVIEDSHNAQPHSESTVGNGIATFGHNEIAARAHQIWTARGCPEGSPEEDWSQAVTDLRSRATTR